MNDTSNRAKRQSTLVGAPEAPVYERLPRPLHRHLATFDAHNARVKLFGESASTLASEEAAHTLKRRFDESDRFSKLTVYAEPADDGVWKAMGFRPEARIRGFFRDGSDAQLMCRYTDTERAESSHAEKEAEVLAIAKSKSPADSVQLSAGFTTRLADAEDAEALSELLISTFEDYPDDPSVKRLRPLIARQQSIFRIIEHEGRIASFASAQVDLARQNAELSDCVTVPDYQGQGLMVATLTGLMKHVSRQFGIKDFYSLARATEVGMNAALARAGFEHDGMLVSNCRMPLGWESMNVWCCQA